MLQIKTVRLDELHNDPANVRLHDKRNLQSIIASLKEFGQVEPLVVQQGTRKVIGGNGRLEAMRELGWQECGIVEFELDHLKATALGITLNRTAELASWDDDALIKQLKALEEEGYSIEAAGFDQKEFDALCKKADKEDDEDKEPEGEDYQSKFDIVVECKSENEQQELFEELSGRGLKCRVLTL
jgi:ParB-like chromosome segregation protein Spo0J